MVGTMSSAMPNKSLIPNTGLDSRFMHYHSTLHTVVEQVSFVLTVTSTVCQRWEETIEISQQKVSTTCCHSALTRPTIFRMLDASLGSSRYWSIYRVSLSRWCSCEILNRLENCDEIFYGSTSCFVAKTISVFGPPDNKRVLSEIGALCFVSDFKGSLFMQIMFINW